MRATATGAVTVSALVAHLGSARAGAADTVSGRLIARFSSAFALAVTGGRLDLLRTIGGAP